MSYHGVSRCAYSNLRTSSPTHLPLDLPVAAQIGGVLFCCFRFMSLAVCDGVTFVRRVGLYHSTLYVALYEGSDLETHNTVTILINTAVCS